MKSPLNRGGLRFYLVAVALGAGTLLFRATTPQSVLTGLPLLCAGVCLHTWAKGCLRQNRMVAKIGPYRYVRHPFYLANAMIDAALAIMAGWLPLVVALPFWWLAIYIPVIRGEERYLAEKFPDEYPQYRRRVPCLIPWRRPLPYAGKGFRWSNPNIAGGEELPRAARILAYPLLFLIAHGLRSDGLQWLKDGWNLTALTGLAAMYLSAWELQRHQRQRRAILPLTVLRHPVFRAAVAAVVLAAIGLVHGPSTSYRNVSPLAGTALVLFSAPIYARRPLRAVLAEMVALFGALVAGELAWLAPLAAAVYEAWLLDWRLAEEPLSFPIGKRSYWPYLYPLVATACAAAAGIGFVTRVMPHHFR